MRILLVTLFVFSSADSFTLDRPKSDVQYTLIGSDGKPLKGKELFKKAHPNFRNIDEIASLIAEQKRKSAERLKNGASRKKNHTMSEYVQKLNPKPFFDEKPSISEINSALGLDEVLIAGDIAMTLEGVRSYFGIADNTSASGDRFKRQATDGGPGSLWSDGVPYNFDPNLNQRARDAIQAAITFWQTNTCVRFQQVDPENSPSYPVLVFIPGLGCWSDVGRESKKRQQELSIGRGCEDVETAAHEIGHALGFIHEQQRWDRDDFIWVDMDNIEDGYDGQYGKNVKGYNVNFDKQYDYRGIMHYDDRSFAKDRTRPVMYAIDPAYQMTIGSGAIPNSGDVYEMNMLYSCYDRCAGLGTVCQNEGRPNPNNCAACQCHGGFGGPDCSQREPASAGLACAEATLPAGPYWQTLAINSQVGNGQDVVGDRVNPLKCTWHMTAPPGRKIQYQVKYVGFDSKEDALCRTQCRAGGLGIKGLEKTWMPEGMRFCCPAQYNNIMTTAANLLVVQPWNSFRYTDFTVQYKLVSLNTGTCPYAYQILSADGTRCYHTYVTELKYDSAKKLCANSDGIVSVDQAASDKAKLRGLISEKVKCALPRKTINGYWHGMSGGQCGIHDLKTQTTSYVDCNGAKGAGVICESPTV
ncbi:hypothetical protein QR680_016245 [Steinernema hermaphroditum]|uniref:Metalloendopeptidase n=1 Tax=Steinernema hermaphroditum TaxID=289476 RepID=A0AA39HAJ4_9BILA|nr:hypothetical protein QR680_016245 [Steinernema hermaphroditum]